MQTDKETSPSTEGEEKEMSFKEKLEYFDREIRLLHQFCINSGYSKEQIQQSAEPFLRATNSLAWQKTKKKMIYFGVIIAVLAALYHLNPAFKFIAAICRITAIKVGHYSVKTRSVVFLFS